MATNLGNGFTFTVPVNDTLSHTLNIYVDVSQGVGNLNASFNDGSTSDYNDSSVSNLTATSTGQYTLTYQAATVPQTLTVTYTLQQGNGSGATIATDSFNRANATGLGSASDGKNAWAVTTLHGSPVWKIVSNQAVMSGTTADTSVALLGTTTISDCDTLCIIQASNVADGIGVILRSSAKATSYYLAQLINNTLQLIYHANGADTLLKSAAVTYKINTQYNIRFRAVNQTLYARFWPNDGSQEPSNWQVTTQDSHLTSGIAGMYGQLSSSSDTATFDAFSAVDLSGAVNPNAYVGMHAATLPGSAPNTSTDALVGTPSTPSGPIDLTGEGTNDWAKFGYTAPSSIDHKTGVTQQISNYTALGSGSYTRNTSAVLGYSWTDGTPDTSATNTTTEVDVGGVGNGFSLTVPADTTSRTLNLYVTATKAQGQFTASLSDDAAGAVTYTDSSLNDSGTGTAKEYSLTYNAASDNQTLTAQWTMLTDNGTGTSTTTYDTDTFTRSNQSGWGTASDSTVWSTPVIQSGTPTYSIASNTGKVAGSGGSATTYDSDTFARANQSGWGTASDGAAWGSPVIQSGTPTYSISSNTGKVTAAGTAVSYSLLGSGTQANAEAVIRWKASVVSADTMALVLRCTAAQTYYRAGVEGGNTLKITKRVSGTDTDVATATFNYTNGTKNWIRFRADGSNLYARAWADGSTEPTSWTITITDSSITGAGGYGIRTKVGASDIVNYDSYSVTNFASTGTTAVSYALLGTSVQNNAIALVRWQSSNAGNDTVGLILRCTAAQTYYRAEVTGGNTLKITKRVSGTDTDLASVGFTYSNATKYWTRFEISGNNLFARAWADGSSEPTSWSVTATDSGITGAGGYGLRSTAASGDTVQFDSYTVTSLPSGGTPGSIGLGAATLIGNAASSPPPPPTPTPNAANVLITVNTATDALSTDWLGYGVEMDAYDHGTGTPIAISSAQRALINHRLGALNPQILRTALGNVSWWCPGGVVGTYNFNTAIMQESYNVFEYAQANTIPVIVSLLSPSPFTNTSTSWCTALADLLDYLINTLGYSCIKYVTGLSQPDTLGASYSDYKNTIEPQLVVALAANHLTVSLLGPDTTQANDSWLTSSSTDLTASLQGYARQAFPSGANDIKGDTKETALKTLVSGIYTNDPTNKPIIQTEMGDAALGPGSNVALYAYGLEMGDFAVQIARTGVAAAIAYLLDDDMHNTQWGFWKITDTTPTIRPWFFVWNVLCNTVVANSTIYAPAQPATNDFRVLASQSAQGSWTFVLVNRNANAQTVSVTIPSAPTATTTLQQYVYSNVAPLLVDTNGFPLASGTVQAVLNRGLVISMAGSSIMILTQQTAIAATSYAVPRPPLEKRR